MKTFCSASILAVLAACATPPSPSGFGESGLLIQAGRALADGEGAPLEDQRFAIRARCDNLINGGKVGYRAQDSRGGWRMEQGSLTRTDRDLDLAIDGEGFFSVIDERGILLYTRDGRVELDGGGNLCIGKRVLNPQISVPQNITRVLVDTTGLIQGLDPTSPSSLHALGQIQVHRFPNAEKLSSQDGVFFAESAESGMPIAGNPGQGGFGLIRQGFEESSNVATQRELLALAEEVCRYEIAVEAWKVKQRIR